MDDAGPTLLVLGRPELDGRALRSAAEQHVLAWAALHAGRGADLDRGGRAIWPDLPAAAASRKARDAARSLSRLFPGSLRTSGGTLEVTVASDRIDEQVFRTLVTSPADGAGAERYRLDAALRLWRGPPYPGLTHVPVVRRRVTELDELRLTALERRFAIDVARQGTPDAVVLGELRASVCSHPHRERLWRLLIAALFHASRQVEALAEIDNCRRVLNDRGTPASRTLDTLQGAVLRGDAAAIRSAM